MADKRNINIVMAGHVDHGKSTVLGRLLADADALPKGKLKKVKAMCERNSKPFEYAFLIDALKEEQSQGITIDSARVFFKTKVREFLIIDAPGHIDFLKNMVTGAARAEAAVLVIDASEGVQENSRRHALLLSMLGIDQVAIAVNKMDLVSFDEERFKSIVDEYSLFLEKIKIKARAFIPVSGIGGDNIVSSGGTMPWYRGKTVLEVMEAFSPNEAPVDLPFRMPVQGVYKFTKFSDDRRIVAGTIDSGRIKVGDEVLFYPSGKKSTVKTIEGFNRPPQDQASAGEAAGFTLTEQIYVSRGEVAIKHEEPLPSATSRVRVSLFWLGKEALKKNKDYIFKIGTSKVLARVEAVEKIFDSSKLDDDLVAKEQVKQNMLAECVIKLKRPVSFDVVGNFQKTSRFVIVDGYDISGGGIVRETLDDEQTWVRDKVLLRNYKWIKSMIPHADRVEKHSQESSLIFITGKQGAGRKTIAKRIEADLFAEGRLVYFLGIGNVLYGVDADIKGMSDTREEHLRRLAEVAHLMLDAGMILIVTAVELTKEDMDIIKPGIGNDKVETVWVGSKVTTDIEYDLKLDKPKDIEKSVALVKELLRKKQIIR